MKRSIELTVDFEDGELLKKAVITNDVIHLFAGERTFSMTREEFDALNHQILLFNEIHEGFGA